MQETIRKYSTQDYINLLPTATRDAATDSIKQNGDLMALAQQIALEPGSGLATKGGVLWPSDLFQRIVKELHLLLCTDDASYADWRKKISSEGTKTARAVVLVVSNAIAASVGLVPALCFPFVAILLAVIAKMSLQAWCKALTTPEPSLQVANGESLPTEEIKSLPNTAESKE